MGRELPNSFGVEDQGSIDTQAQYVQSPDSFFRHSGSSPPQPPSQEEIALSAVETLQREEAERCGAVQGVKLYTATTFKPSWTRSKL